MVARFDPIKDHATFLQAAALLLKSHRDKVVFMLIGDDMENSNAALVELIARKGLSEHVLLTGRRNDMADVYSALDVLILSSRGEAFPNVICEGMLCELPCVSTKVGDCSDIIGDTGFLTEPGSPEALHDALSRMVRLDSAYPGERSAAPNGSAADSTV
jgi:glycosyltransferase involved in cell wall biosynthesis